MLILLVGGTLEVAHHSRQYFLNKGFEIIQKYNYLPDNSLGEHYDKFKNYDEETVNKCDFVYPIHNGKTGFYKSQILDAVRGRINALMTASPDNLDFVKEIKDAYGEYVKMIYLYIDKTSLEGMTRKFINDEGDIIKRLAKGTALRKLYIEEKALFDNLVVYEENGELGYEALYNQFDHIIEDAERLQKKLNNKMFIDLPYRGNKNYIFVSYSHKDEKKIIPILSSLQREGYRIWYDEGIHTGKNWMVMLGERLQGCTNFLLFSSVNSSASQRVQEEVGGAQMCDLEPITVRMDDAKFPFGYEMFLSKYQNAFLSDKNFFEKLTSSLSELTKD